MKKPSDLDIRLKLAEFDGWTQIENTNTMAVCGIWRGYPPCGAIIGHKQLIPDYTGDLNVIHKLEKKLTDKQYSKFEDTVWDIQSLEEGEWRAFPTAAGGTVNMPSKRVRMTSPNASQRARAIFTILTGVTELKIEK